MSVPIFEARDITKVYGNYVALNNVSIKVEKGSIFGLLGPNGAGKTSLIRIINQITAPDQGEAFFNGEPLKPEHVSRIGYLPEERGLYRKMQVGEQCMYLAQLKGLDHKIQFIVTVLHEPELLIFDEPFTGFDPVNANLIRDEILELRRNGSTIIFSTHRMETVEELCDSIALINKSQKILDGKVADIKREFRTNTYKMEFNGNMLAFTNALWAGAELLDRKQVDNHCTVTLRLAGNNTVNNLFAAIMPICEIISFNEVIPSMSDIFIRTVQPDIQ